MANDTQDSTKCGKPRAGAEATFFRKAEAVCPAFAARTMDPDTTDSAAERVDLCDVVGEMKGELRCLLGPKIRLATGRLPVGGPAPVRARHDEIVDLLRHLALDAHDAMPAGTVTIRTGRLREVEECVALVIHEVPEAAVGEGDGSEGQHKGRSLGLGASYDTVARAGGHFHVSCRGRETVLTICFPLAG